MQCELASRVHLRGDGGPRRCRVLIEDRHCLATRIAQHENKIMLKQVLADNENVKNREIEKVENSLLDCTF